jgi:hypothetical protein
MRNKIFFALMVVFLVASLASASKVSPIPACQYKAQGSQTQQYGKLGFDNNGNIYRWVYNAAVTTEAKNPCWYINSSTESYNVRSSYEATSRLQNFAGIWYCDSDGDTAISVGEYGWIQVAGLCVASVEGTGADIVIGDLLTGIVNTAGGKALVHGRAALTKLTYDASGEALATVPGPIAMEGFTDNAVGTIEVFLRGCY